MGTRHLICIYHNGQIVIAQYGQFDGYPDGVGVQILRFLKTPVNIARLRSGLPFIKVSSTEHYCNCYTEFGSIKFLNSLAEAGDKGGEVTVEVEMGLEFAKDTLFCERAYVIDLDEGCLETYFPDDGRKLQDPQLGGGKGRLVEAGVQEQALVGKWKFGDAIEDDEWMSACLAPKRATRG